MQEISMSDYISFEFPFRRPSAGAGRRALFGLALSALSVSAMADIGVNKSFSPFSASINQASTLTIDLINANPVVVSGVSVTDTLPAGLLIASPTNVSNGCGGSVSATAGGNAIALSAGTIAAAGADAAKCTIKVDVVSSTANTYVNTIPSGSVASSQGSNSQAAQATYTVVALAPVSGSIAFSPGIVHGYDTTRMTITLPNTNTNALTGVSLTDTLPPKLALAGKPNLATTCGAGIVSNTATTLTLSGGTIPANGSCTISADVTPSDPTTFYNNNNTGDAQNVVNNTIPVGALQSDQGVTNAAFNKTLKMQTGLSVQKVITAATIPSGGQALLLINMLYYNAIPMTSIDLTDTLPAGMSIVPGSSHINCPGGTLSLTSTSLQISGGPLPAAASGVAGPSFCKADVQVTASNPGSDPLILTNTIPAGSMSGLPYDATSATLTIAPVSPISGSKSFTPGVQTGTSMLTITLNNLTSNDLPITDFSDDLLSMRSGGGFTIAAAPPASTTCAGGFPAAAPGGTVITMSSGTIPANGSCTITASVQIAGTVPQSPSGYFNTIATGAVVTMQGSNTLPISGYLTVAPGLSVNEAFNPSSVFAGTDSQLTITFTRPAGATALTGLSLTDTLPAGHVVSSASPATTTCGGLVTATAGSATFTLSGGTLPAGAGTTSCTVTVPVTTPNTAGSATNTIATNQVATNEGAKFVGPATASLTRIANVNLSKGFNPTVVAVGGTSHLSIQILNNSAGAVSLTNASLADSLPTGMKIATPPNASFSGTGCSGTLTAAGGATSFQLSNASVGIGSTCEIDVDVVALAAGNLINSLPAGAFTSAEGASNTALVSATLTANGNADLSVTKTDGVTTAFAGATVTYTVAFANAGPNDVAGAPITDDQPAGVTFVSWTCAASAGGTCPAASGSGPLTGNLVSIPHNGTVTFTVVAQIAAGTTGSIANTASITTPASVVDSNQNNNTATDTDTIGSQADLSITKTDGTSTYTPGSTLVYTVTVSNAGPADVSGATVTDILPASISAANWTCAATGAATCPPSGSGSINASVDLPAGSQVIFTVNATVSATATGDLTNTATITAPADVTDPNLANNVATDTDTSSVSSDTVDLAVTVDDFNTYARGNSLLDYVIVVQNKGPADAHGAKVSYSMPSNFVNAMWTCEPAGTATCTASGTGTINDTVDIPANGSLLYHLSGTVLALPEFPVVQSVNVSASASQTDSNASNNSATDTDIVGIFANGFDSQRLGSSRFVTVAEGSASMDVVALSADDVADDLSEGTPFLAVEIIDASGNRASDLHVRKIAGHDQARLSFRNDDGIWLVGTWMNIPDHTALYLGWRTTDKGTTHALDRVELHDDTQFISATGATE
jgi:uncharacterized repeat protein (TIGR01451 family)